MLIIFAALFLFIVRVKLDPYISGPLEQFKGWLYHQTQVRKRKKRRF